MGGREVLDKNIYISEGNSFNDALSKGLQELGCSKEDIDIKIIEEGKKLFGITRKKYKLEIRKKTKKKVENKQDGFFDIFFREDGVYLSVFIPTGGGKRVKIEDVMKRIETKKIKDADIKQIRMALSTSEGGTFKIAETQEEELIDGSVEINVSKDKMTAIMVLYPPDGGKEVSLEDVMAIIAEKGIVVGVKETEIKKAVSNNIFKKEIVIAEGRKPIDGENAELKLKFETVQSTAPKLLEDGRVDYRDIDSIINVKEGQVLAEIAPPTEGEPGYTVTGELIEAKKGKDIVKPIGKNVEYIEEERKIISKIDGKAEYRKGKIDVVNLLDIKGDLDMSVGNIDFSGDVLIRGNVIMGFKLIASGSVEVFGVVEGAEIEAEGDVVLRQGIQGMGKGQIRCKGNLVAKFIENANIEVSGYIKADSIIHSNIKCEDRLFVSGRKGLIVGGRIRVCNHIVAKTLGSPTGTITHIDLGVLPEVRTNYERLKEEIKQLTIDKEEIEKTITLIEKLKLKSALTNQKEAIRLEAEKRKVMLANILTEKESEFKSLEEEIGRASDAGVHISGVIYPGVRITIGSSTMIVYDKYEFSTFESDGVDIVLKEYSGDKIKMY